ncbi:hypothetical protein ABL78_4128 [Leptomonas seymouri]|uniref:Uncharacterized protein n=1 Tax=Leptomonas seymouri TaxID=5684 RepID=A0A0N1PEC1_LEPSE|nr:hypothetical protein ABL78_4128 [Leptomonas seymouri]|eukprot:KPI86804.1 hypothetical protein ABL78_4128 [Leptomonas seymouri]
MQLEVTGRWFQTKEDTYVSLPLVNRAVDRGEPRQLLCTEMIHWDDYRRDRNINDGKPPMQQLFASEREEVPLHIFTIGSDTFVSQVIGVGPTQAGSSSQMFCSEMQHWDDYCAQRGINTGTSTMSALYRSFERKEFAVLDMNEQKVKFYGGDSVALISCGGEKQTYCSEMEHWDDYVKAKTGQLPQPSMASLFRQQ